MTIAYIIISICMEKKNYSKLSMKRVSYLRPRHQLLSYIIDLLPLEEKRLPYMIIDSSSTTVVDS